MNIQCNSQKLSQLFVYLLPLAPCVDSFILCTVLLDMPFSLDFIVELLGFPWESHPFSHPEQFGPTERIY